MNRAPLSLPGRTVIFDYGDVISLAQSNADRAALVSIAALADEDVAPFWQAYWAHRDRLDQGTISPAGYWRAIAGDIGCLWFEPQVLALGAADFRSWVSVNEETIEVLEDLREGGTRLALLSNAGREFGGYFRHGALGGFFERCYVSGELGLLKPHPEIYRHVLADLGITPAEAIFVDNREPNVTGAEALGITGHVFTGAAALRTFLTSLAGPGAG